MKNRTLILALGIAACTLFFSVKSASAQGPGYGYGNGHREGHVSVQVGHGGGYYGGGYRGGYGRGGYGDYGGYDRCDHRPPVVIVAPPRPYYPPCGSYYAPPVHRYHGGPYRW